MFELQITDMHTARSRYYAWADRIISILDPVLAGAWEVKDDRHLIIHFDDIEDAEPHLVLPVRADLLRMLEFARVLGPKDRFLVHCHAGVSRSTAAAIAILIDHGQPLESAFDQVSTLRGDLFWPNQRIIGLADAHLGLGGRLDRHVRQWKADQRHRLSQQPDENAALYLHRLTALERAAARDHG